VWALRFLPGEPAAALAEDLAITRDRAHGLFANPQFQDARVCAGGTLPLDGLSRKPTRASGRARRPA
jgi:hypothetical protein